MNKNPYSKLTPSAKNELNKIADEFKNKLLEKAFLIATERNTAGREISLRDILEAQQPSDWLNESFEYYEYKKRRRIIIILISGALYTISGILIYLYQNNLFSIKNEIGLTISLIGIIVSIFAFIYYQFSMRRISYFNNNTSIQKSYRSPSYNFEIVKRWQMIEELAKSSMSQEEQNSISSNSVSYLIRFLSHKIAKDEDDFQKIRELLQLRNKIVHEQYRPNSKENTEFLNFSEDLINRLENQQKTKSLKKNKLKIIEARYGNPSKYVDATKELQQLVKNNQLEFIVNNDIVGDPDYGTPKHLILIYELGGKKGRDTFNEGTKVILEG